MILEGKTYLSPVGDNLVVLDTHIKRFYFCDPKILQAFASCFHSIFCSIFPGIFACADQFDHFINTSGHFAPPFLVYRYRTNCCPLISNLKQVYNHATCLAALQHALYKTGELRKPAFSSKRFEVFKGVRAGDRITSFIYKTARFGDFGIVEGTLTRGDELVASGEIKIWHQD